MSDADRTRWDERYRDAEAISEAPSSALLAVESLVPRAGRALDVGGGAGRHAIWLARRGLDVTLVDISSVACDLAAERAERADVRLRIATLDLDVSPLPSGPDKLAGANWPTAGCAGPWDMILSFHYLARSLFGSFASMLAEGGVLVVVHPTRRNLERHARPGERFLLEEGELRTLCAELTIVRYDEGWLEDGRHEARVVARRERRQLPFERMVT